ncbi:MAG: HAD family phosphatase [Cyclobacteriaceae bacterium]|nr:HAD family phosphatase [Cyclobacteriaceae bacterium]
MDFAVIFDMDGVLVHNDQYHLEAWRIFCERRGRKVEYPEITALFGNTNAQFLRKLISPEVTVDEIARYAVEKETIYQELFDKFIEPAEGLIPFLNDLKKHQIPMAVATSAPTENLNFVLDRCGIRHYFDKLVDETFVTHGKPDPEIYLKTAELLGLLPNHCVVIEDALFGIEAAQLAGMKVIGLASTLPMEKLSHTDLSINTFNDLDLMTLERLMDNKK